MLSNIELPQDEREKIDVCHFGERRECAGHENRREVRVVEDGVILVGDWEEAAVRRYDEEDESWDDSIWFEGRGTQSKRVEEKVDVDQGAEFQQPEEDGEVRQLSRKRDAGSKRFSGPIPVLSSAQQRNHFASGFAP